MKLDVVKYWVYYFYLYSALLLLSPLGVINSTLGGFVDIILLLQMVFGIIAWLGLYGYIYSKRYFNRGFWLIFFAIEIIQFLISIGWPMLNVIVDSVEFGVYNSLILFLVLVFMLCFYFPILIAHYRYIFTHRWNIRMA